MPAVMEQQVSPIPCQNTIGSAGFVGSRDENTTAKSKAKTRIPKSSFISSENVEMQTLNEVHRFEADRERVWFVAWSPNGTIFH